MYSWYQRRRYSEDASGETRTRNPSVINRVFLPLSSTAQKLVLGMSWVYPDGVLHHYAFIISYWVAVRRTYVFTLQEVEKICRTIQSHVILAWTIRSRTASCFKPQVAIFQLRSSYKLDKGFT